MTEKPETDSWQDPIVGEVRHLREALFAEAGHDIHEFCRRLRGREEGNGRPAMRAEDRANRRATLIGVSREALLQPAAGTVLSLEDWAALREDDSGELVDGRLEAGEVSELGHEVLVAALCHLLRAWLRPHGGLVAASGVKLPIDEQRGRMPDVAVFLPGNLPPARGLLRVPPDLVVEIVSATPRDARRDRVEKLNDYAAAGVRWYWIVDPELRSFEILERGKDTRYVHALAATGGVIDPVPGCEGLTLDLDDLWAEMDRLPNEQPPR